MAIKNTSFIFAACSLFAALLLLGCQHGKNVAPSNPHIQPPMRSGETSATSGSSESVHLPDFVGQRAPRVGLIFGPGGAKTFAHIGVLQEIEKYKIPVVAVAGLEWGALVGSIYALNGQSHEVDWKMSQLPKSSFSSKNLFSKKMRAATTKDFDQYLKKIFSDSKIENSKVPFACPFIRGATGKVGLANKGITSSVLRSCWYYPPIFELSETMAAPFSVYEAAEYLRQEGAELIVLINVLDGVNKKDFAEWTEEDWSWFAWVPVQSALRGARYAGVHEVITVDTSSYEMFDVSQRLRLIQVGKQGAGAAIDRIVKKYDF